jgi:hypothetical protein
MRSSSWLVAVVITSFLALGTLAFAQSATTSLHGTISDAKGAMVAGATVTLNNPATGFSRTLKSDDQGSYQFLEMPPSTYIMTVTAPGFATTKRESVVLQVSSPATVNMVLQVQGGSVVVDVTAETPMVNTQDATLGNNFGARQLTDLPSEGRDPASILSLQPGVVYVGKMTDSQQDDDSRGGSVNGARSDQTNITLDGLDDNDQLKGYAFEGAMRATLDSLQEFRVTTSNYDASAGRSSGAQVNLVTKSGTNAFHGSGYEYYRPNFTVANDWFNKQAELNAGLPNVPGFVLRNTFGGTIGGPLKKDRLFFFAAYEGQRTADQLQTTRVVPTASMTAGQLKYLCNPDQTVQSPDPNCLTTNSTVSVVDGGTTFAGFDVATLTPGQIATLDQGCAGNLTCPLGAGPNPLIANINGGNPSALFTKYSLPNSTSGGGDGLNTAAYTFPGNNPTSHNTYIFKLDYKISANGNHSLFIRGNLQNDHESSPPQFPGLPPNSVLTNNSKGIAGGYTYIIRNNLINNFRYAFIRQGLGNSGLNNQPFNRLRGLDDSQGLTSTVLTNVPVNNFIDDVSWIRGRHTIQFGTNWRLIHNNRQSNAQNLSEGYANLYWMSPSFISGTGASLDPALGAGFPLVDGSFGTSYDFAAVQLAGIMSQVYTVTNQDKNANLVPSGALVQRHFRNFEGEMYLQDKWNATPNLVFTYGVRYSMLQPPYESGGNQVSPTVNMNQWFTNRWKGQLQGNVVQPDLSFDLSGQANGKKPYWAWDYKNLAPRFAVAYSPHAASGFWHKVFGDPGKSSVRAGYGFYFDHFGEGVVNTFDRQGSWGLTTTISNPAGVLGVDTAPRYTGLLGAANLPPSPGVPSPHGFPYSPSTDPNTYGLAIAWGIDDNLKTPYSHVVDFSISRDLGHNFVLEATYTGRFAHHLLQEIDLSQPLDLVDPASKTDYFTAAQALSKQAYAGVQTADVQPISYWENLFPQAAGQGLLSGSNGNPCSGGPVPTNPTATQNIYDMYNCNLGNETLSLELLDAFCFPACAGTGSNSLGGFVGSAGTPFSFYQPQFSSLYGWQSRGNSNYNGLQVSLRHAMSAGLQFDLNYTYSKSIDAGSNAERVNGFESGGLAFNSQVINAFSPNLWRAPSDFDTTHQINSNWVWDVPFGKGRHWGAGSNSIVNAIFGGWGVNGLYRWTSGFPFTVGAGAGWATNFELEGSSVVIGAKPKTGVFRDASGDPTVFQNPTNLVCACGPGTLAGANFRATMPGEAGQRNIFRGPGYFGVDAGLAKTWNFSEARLLRFSWEVFNVTNSVRFDAAGSLINQDLVDITGFGKFNTSLTSPRVMQFALRFAF